MFWLYYTVRAAKNKGHRAAVYIDFIIENPNKGYSLQVTYTLFQKA